MITATIVILCDLEYWILFVLQACLVIGGLLSYFLVFLPTIRELSSVLKHARGTLLQFPEEVLGGIAAIRNLIKEFRKGGTQ